MRNILIACGVLLGIGAAYFFWSRSKPQHFGEPFANAPTVSVSELLDHPADHVKHTVAIEGTVQKQCPVSGCFFYFKDGSKELKVELGDTLPTLPQKIGSRARVEGQLVEASGSYVFIGKVVEFGGESTAAPVKEKSVAKTTEPAKSAVQAVVSKDGYPIDTCVVSGEKLGDMGEIINYSYQGRTVKFCCKACQKDFDAEPAKFIKKLDAAGQTKEVH